MDCQNNKKANYNFIKCSLLFLLVDKSKEVNQLRW